MIYEKIYNGGSCFANFDCFIAFLNSDNTKKQTGVQICRNHESNNWEREKKWLSEDTNAALSSEDRKQEDLKTVNSVE